MDMHEIYMTTEQIQRLAALSLDALVGIQLATTVADNTKVTGTFVSIDDPTKTYFFHIKPDGTYGIES